MFCEALAGNPLFSPVSGAYYAAAMRNSVPIGRPVKPGRNCGRSEENGTVVSCRNDISGFPGRNLPASSYVSRKIVILAHSGLPVTRAESEGARRCIDPLMVQGRPGAP